MNENAIAVVLVAAVLLLSVIQMVQISGISGQATNAAGAASGLATAQAGGETYQQMMERMHGSGSSAASGISAPTMVGGC